jgi:outer membrane protein TolC
MSGMDPNMDPNMDPGTEPTGSSLSTPEETASAVSRAGARITLSHSLLRGFGRGVARADREKARLATTAAELRAEGLAAGLLGEISGSFWELAFAAKSLEVRRASLELSRKLYTEAKAAVREGSRPTSDLQVAAYSMAVREEQVLMAELALEEKSLSVRQIAGLEIGPDDLVLWPTDLPEVGDRELSVAGQVRRGVARNRELAALMRDERSAGVDVRVARNSTRPQLDLVGAAGYSGSGANVDEALAKIGEAGELDVSLGLQLSMDLGGNSARGNLKAARFQRQVRRIEIEEQRRKVASAVVLAVHRIRAAQKRAQVSASAIELARANLVAERARFRVGRASSRDLFERQDELDDARLSRVRAVADYHESLGALEVLTGDILNRYAVEVLP